MITLKKMAITVAGVALAAGGVLTLTIPAGATTSTCTNVANSLVPPIGCGGDQLAYKPSAGPLDLAVLGGNYWNSPVGFKTDSASDSTEDFTVFAVGGSISDGPGSLGEYVAMYTPFGNIPTFTGKVKGVTGTYTNTTPDIDTPFTVGTNVYCLSVANTGSGASLRWHTVLRLCNTNGIFQYGKNDGTTYNAVSAAKANKYQVWAPVQGSVSLLMVNDTLSHGFKSGNTPYVLDDAGWGGSGTQGLAYPENDGLNQQSVIEGCTDPIKGLLTKVGTNDANCP